MAINFKIHNENKLIPCKFCSSLKEDGEQRWHLADYYGLSGTACSSCYSKISHDSYGKPNNPEEYLILLLKYGKMPSL